LFSVVYKSLVSQLSYFHIDAKPPGCRVGGLLRIPLCLRGILSALLFLLSLTTGQALAQTSSPSAAVSGTVRDISGAAVADATVILEGNGSSEMV
jgi:hypothetical protein